MRFIFHSLKTFNQFPISDTLWCDSDDVNDVILDADALKFVSKKIDLHYLI